MLLALLVFFPMAVCLPAYALGRHNKEARNRAVILLCLFEFLLAAAAFLKAENGQTLTLDLPGLCGFGLSFELDGFRALYALVGGGMWLLAALFSREYFAHRYHNRNRYYLFYLMTLGAALGVFLSADLLTAFLFFEIMSLTSYAWVAHDETPEALRAAETYLAVAVIGGMVLLMGLFLLYTALGTLRISELHAAAASCTDRGTLWAACLCILLGFGAKAGMFPLHIWLPKAHPVAPAPASALLSGYLTKAGLYGVIVISAGLFGGNRVWGNLLLVLALITMLGGAVLAVFSVNLKRTLACSSMSQIGFILTGVAMSCLLGEENALAARGALLYMLNHSLFKLVLFMAAGVVHMNLHQLNLNEIRGFGRGKPFLHAAFLMGALGLMGVPLFSGYISKTLIHEGIVEYVHLLAGQGRTVGAGLYTLAEWVYLFSGGLTSAYMLKLYICLFWEKRPEGAQPGHRPYIHALFRLALAAGALLVPVLGMMPHTMMDPLADLAGPFLHAGRPAHAVEYFSAVNLKGACISLGIGVGVYLGVIRPLLMRREGGTRVYVDRWPSRMDIEERVYRPAIGALLRLGGLLAALGSEQVLERRIYRPVLVTLIYVGTAAARMLDSLTDTVARLLCGAAKAICGCADRLVSGERWARAARGCVSRAHAWIRRMHEGACRRGERLAGGALLRLRDLRGTSRERFRPLAGRTAAFGEEARARISLMPEMTRCVLNLALAALCIALAYLLFR